MERELARWHRFVSDRLGGAARLRPCGNPDGEARVWRVELGSGAKAFVAAGDDHGGPPKKAYLKLHRVADKWQRERTILERLAEPPAAAVPALLAVEPQGLALLLAPRPGVLATSRSWSAAEQQALHEQAGRFRRRLDAVPVDDDDALPLPDAMRRRLHAWIERARPGLHAPLRRAVEASFDARCFEGATRRWSHRDLAPHNWVVEPSPAGPLLSVIDFGQARPDAWLVDVLKLWDEPWVHDPSLAEAFWRGYGRRPDPVESEQLRQLALLHGLATAAWGDRHGHAALSQHGRAVLARVLERPVEPAP